MTSVTIGEVELETKDGRADRLLNRQSLLHRFAISRFARFLGRYLPWLDFYPAPAGLILRELSNCGGVLDVGCGNGRVLSRLRFLDHKRRLRRTAFVGLDSWRPSLIESKNIHNEVVLCCAPYLPLREYQFDCIIAVDFLEHLRRTDALKVLNEFERMSDCVMLLIPVGYCKKRELEDENPFQQHFSWWNPKELESRGYSVQGINGFRGFRKDSGQFRIPSLLALPLQVILALVSQLFVYRMPQAAYHMFCVKQRAR